MRCFSVQVKPVDGDGEMSHTSVSVGAHFQPHRMAAAACGSLPGQDGLGPSSMASVTHSLETSAYTHRLPRCDSSIAL